MDSCRAAPSPSARPERVTPLPRLGREVDAWMWKVLNGGTVPSDRRIGDLHTVQAHAQTLRAAGQKGQADAPLDGEKQKAATEYARLLGWRVEEGGEEPTAEIMR